MHRPGGFGMAITMERDDADQYVSEETARRMERGIWRFLNTPPQPRGKSPAAKPKEQGGSSRRQRPRPDGSEK